jgi:DNA-binding CsgD family transcriptional regulator
MQALAATVDHAVYETARRSASRLPEFIVDGGLRLISCNPAFQTFVGADDVFKVRDKALVFPDRTAHAAFRDFLSTLGAEPATWLFRRPEDDSLLILRCERVAPAGRPPAVVCTIHDSRDRGLQVWGDFGTLYGLTASENQIARLLMQGETLADASARLGITAETAKTHLRRIYAKVGVGSREGLYARLLPFRVA